MDKEHALFHLAAIGRQDRRDVVSIWPLVPGKANVAVDAELRPLPVSFQPQAHLAEALCQDLDQVTHRLEQLLFEKTAVLLEPFSALVKIQRLEKGNGPLPKTVERSHVSLPCRPARAIHPRRSPRCRVRLPAW